ncbi:spindle assembly checkpoint component Mad1 [Morchella snyderi]|nr:spindle assembly checkpoint component Mad1 [Morchella snyderi]
MDHSSFSQTPSRNLPARSPGNQTLCSPASRGRQRVPPNRTFANQRVSDGRRTLAEQDYTLPTPPELSQLPQTIQQRSYLPVGVGTKADLSNEGIRADLNSVRYELSTLQEERELEKIRHEKEIRELQLKLEEQSKKSDASEADKRYLFEKQKDLSENLQKVKDQAASHKQDLERQIRMLKAENILLKETICEKDENTQSQDRKYRQQVADLKSRNEALVKMNKEMGEELEAKGLGLQQTQTTLSTKEAELGNLETELLKARAQTGDLDTLKILKKDLSEQVAHIKTLEATSRKQTQELKQLRDHNKSIEILEEEKQALESKVRMMDTLRHEISEAQLRVSILQDERNSWSSYFESEGLEFDSPEALARALVHERVEKAALIERAGRTNPEITEKEEAIQRLELELSTIRREFEKTKEDLGKDSRARQRLERQRALAMKEAQFLRDQLKSFSTEEKMYMEGNFDEQKTKRIEELEVLLETYKKENESLLVDVVKREGVAENEFNPRKRSREDDVDESKRIGELMRKNRQLQDDIAQLQQSLEMSKKEIESLNIRLASASSTSTRILQLKDNPTSREEAIKTETLVALREENAALLAQLEDRLETLPSNNNKVVPLRTLENARKEIQMMEKTVADKEKRMLRLKEIWAAKSMEFREAVFSLLGWKLDFLPNGRVKVTHMFAGNSDEQSIEFDGEKGTMKVSGGPNSMFRREIKNQCTFWMARNSIPCLLSSILIEQYEKTTRAQM